MSEEAASTADEKTNVTVSAEDKSAIEAVEVAAAGAEVDISASGESTIGGVIVSESASGTANEKTNVIVATENKAAVGFFEMLAAGIKAVITASGKSTVGKVTVPGSASSPDTTVEVKAEDSAEISSVTTSAKDANVSVTANGQSKVGTVKMEGAAQATVDGDSSNTTTVDITNAVKGAKLVVKTGSVEIETTPDTATSSIVTNDSGSSIPTKSTNSDNNEQSGSIPAKDSGSGGGSEGGSGGSYTPSSDVVSRVSIDNPNPKVGDTIRATAYPATASNVSSYTTYQWYISENGKEYWEAIQDANKSTYTVAETDGNMFLKCEMGGEGVKTVSGVTTKAVAQLYEINFTPAPIGGTVAVTVAGKAIENGGKAAQGDNVTVVPSPSTGYEVKTVEIRDKVTGEDVIRDKVTGEDVNLTTEPVLKGTYPFTMPAGDVTVAVTFRKIQYTVKFNANNGSGSMNGQENAKVGDNVTKNTLTRDGYVFAGWATAADGEVVLGDQAALTSAVVAKANASKEITLFAVWTEKTYKITYALAAEETKAAAKEGVTDFTQTIKYSDVSGHDAEKKLTPVADLFAVNAGYEFEKWTTGDYTDNQNVATTVKGLLDSATVAETEVTLTANWKEITYTVKYNMNDGRGVMDVQENAAVGDDLMPCSVTREGYEFAGWATEANGAKVLDDLAALTSAVVAKANANKEITLFAVWAPLYTIIDPSRASFTIEVDEKDKDVAVAGAKVTLTPSEPLTEEKEVTVSYTLSGEPTKVEVVEKTEEGKYTFTMPAADVTVAIRTKTYAITNNADTVVTSVKVGDNEVRAAEKEAVVVLGLADALDNQEIVVSTAEGTVEVTKVEDKTYNFTMPGEAVTITIRPLQ